MDNTCVCCGAALPTESCSHVCKKCENLDGDHHVPCLNCGEPLSVINYHWYKTVAGHAKNTVFHCESCRLDWEKDEEFIAQPIKFKRKFWG